MTVSEPLYPLTVFYAQSQLPLPAIENVDGDNLPQPYRRLLVHDADMTSTLEKQYSQPIVLKPLMRHRDGEALMRQVVLVGERDGRPAEFGAIRIELPLFDPPVQDVIRACRMPLGSILHKYAIEYVSRPSHFFSVPADETIRRGLGMQGEMALYGRRNTLSTSAGKVLAVVVEILAPCEND